MDFLFVSLLTREEEEKEEEEAALSVEVKKKVVEVKKKKKTLFPYLWYSRQSTYLPISSGAFSAHVLSLSMSSF